MIMANLMCYLNWLLVVLALCTLQGDATFNRQYRYVRVSLQQSEYTVKESDGRVAITVKADRRYFYGSFYVKIRASVNRDLDPYASSSDFEESLQAVRFSYKQSTATVYIKINDDDRVEDTEAFQVELLIPRDLYSKGVQFGKPAKAKVFIKDDDKPIVTKGPSIKNYGVHVRFSHDEYRVKESDGHVVIKVIVSGRRNFPLQVVAKAFVPTKFNLPAANGKDFKVGQYKLYFPVHYNEATVKIPIYNDYIVEGTEAFAVSLYIPEYRNRYVEYGKPFLTKVIIDDDDRHPVTKPPPPPTTKKPYSPTVKPVPSIYAQFSYGKYVVSESAGYAKIEVTVTGYRSIPISVNVKIFVSDKYEPRAASTNDVRIGETRLVFYPHEKAKTVRVTIIDDKLIEETEAFGVKLIVPDHHIRNGVKLGNPSVAVVYIKDDDKPPATMPPTKPPTPHPPKKPPVTKIQFEYALYKVQESCTLLSVTLVLKGVVIKPFTVGVIPMGHYMLSAQAGKDFETGVVKVTFQPYQTRASVCIVITDDDIKEGSEKFRLILSIPHSARALGIWAAYPYYADVLIIDDVDDGLGLPVQLPPTAYERSTLCKCKPRPTPPPRAPKITVSFKESSYSNIESGGNITFTVQASPASTKPFSVGFCTQNANPVSAEDGVDYTAADIVVTFPPGEDCVLVNVGITDDRINEENETFIGILKTLDATPGNIMIGKPSRAVGTIIDDDIIIVQFLRNLSSAIESAGVIPFTIISLATSDRPFSVRVLTRETTSPPAENDNDYAFLIQDVVFNPGESSQVIFVEINDDRIVEFDEDFEVFLMVIPDSPNVVLGNPSVATGIIIDDDALTVQFLNDTSSAIESDGSMSFTLVSSTISDIPFSVQVCTRDIDPPAAQADTDYLTLVQNITFESGENSTVFTVTIVNDTLPEIDESFEVVLKSLPDFPNVTIGIPSVAVGTIFDDDLPIVQFLNDSSSAVESDGVMSFTVISLMPTDRVFSVQVCTRDIPASAEADIDYDSLVQTILTFDGTDNSQVVSVNITDDFVTESDESFEVFLKLIPGSLDVLLGDPSVAIGTIIDDDDRLIVQFLNDTSSAIESDGSMSFTLVSSTTSDIPFSVQVCTRDIDPPAAQADTDYLTLVQNITFESGENSTVFTVTIVNDTLPEIDESFEVVLKSLPDSPNVVIGVPSVATGTIFDDDLPVVQFLNNASSAVESDGVISFTVVSLMPTDRVFSVQVCTRDIPGSAEAGIDYVSLVQTILTFDGIDNSQVVSVNITDDLIAESDESFEVFLKLVPGSLDVVLGNPSVAIGTIFDDEIPSVRLLTNVTSVGESDGAVTLTLVSSFPSNNPFTVQVFTMDREEMTANSSMDFMPILINVTFEAGETIKNITVPIIPDEIVEEDERFYVQLEGFVDQPNTIGEPDGAWVTIIDDDLTVQYESIVVSGDESDGRLTFALVTSEPAEEPFTVQVCTRELNETSSPTGEFATADVDYDSDVINVTFNAGENRVTVSINITDDNDDEGDEAFGLVLKETDDTPDTVQIIGPTTALGIIEDNDEPGVRFQSNSSTAAESVGSISFMVELTAPADTVITVQVCTEETTPVPSAEGKGVDFTDLVQNVTFDIGETKQNVLVEIIRDSVVEPTEEFNLVLKHVPGGDTSIAILEPSVSVGIILDTTPVNVQFANEEVVNNEGDLSMTFELVLSGPVNNPFVVEVCTTNGSALGEGVDYTTVFTNVTFPAGNTSQTVIVPLNNDDILEPTEQFQVVIKEIYVIGEEPIPSVVLGAITEANGTILDDDDFTVMFNATNYSGAEADGVIAVTVVATGVSSLPYSVTITPIELATASAARELFDYSNDTIVVTFNPGETEQTVFIDINPDCLREGSEFFNLSLSLDPASTPPGITLGDPSVVTAEIEDTDIIFINFTQPTFTTTEASGMMTVTVEADGFSTWPYSVEINPVEILPVGAPGNAEGNGTDFDSDTLIAIFNPGDSQVEVTMPVTMDRIFEPTEALQFSLTVPDEFSNMDGRLLIKPGSNNMAVGEIVDSNVLVNFSTDSYRAEVNATNVVVRVMAFGSFDTPFLVEVVPDVDEDIPEREPFFDPTPREVLFPLGVTTALVTVPLFPEVVMERDLSFIVRLVVPVAAMSQGVVLGEPNVARVTVPATRP